MTFGSPWMLLLAAPACVAAWRLLRRGRKQGILFPAVNRLPPSNGGWRAVLAAVAPFMLIAALLLLTMAAARPRTPVSHGRKEVDAIAIAMAVDVSGSMEALDLAPEGTTAYTREMTRLAVVKKLFAEFVERRPDDLIGLVTFAGYASTRVPLTADHEALLKVLKGVELASIALDRNGRQIAGDEMMTAIGDGLSTAILRLKDAKPVSKVVILLSDGENNTGAVTPEEAARAAAELGIKVYAIGVGTKSNRTPVIARDFFGREYVDHVNMQFDEAQLKSIADATGGRYFAVDDKDSLERALEEIDRLETTRLDADVYGRWNEHFSGFLLAGALLAVAAVTLSMAATRRLM